MDPAVATELRALYQALEEELGRRAPRCELSGRCCDFKTSGHVLFATDLEVDFALQESSAAQGPAGEVRGAVDDPELCPFHVEGLCGLRGGRPMGCRVYFCDPTYADEMPEVAERYHRQVIAIHERYGLPYRYGRFVASIREAKPE